MSRRGVPAAIATVLLAGVMFIPYCGVLFDCGCSWPWAGSTGSCNIYNPRAVHRCPWCAHPVAGGSSFLAAAAAGVAVALRGDARSRGPGAGGGHSPAGRSGAFPAGSGAAKPAPRVASPRPPAWDLVVRTLAGLGAFLSVAFIAGWLTALVTGYPGFLGF